jgi:predicted phosphodiesterase
VAGYQYRAGAGEGTELNQLKKGLPGISESRNMRVIRQVQAAVSSKPSFTFAVFGDTHDDFENFKKLAEHAAAQGADFIIHTGDFTNDGRLQEYLDTLRFIDQLGVPVIVAAGNHDMDNNGPRIYSRIFGSPNFYFDLPGARFVFLNNVKRDINSDLENAAEDHHDPGLSRGLDLQTIGSVERLLRNGTGKTFFVMHMPPPLQLFKDHCFSRNGGHFIDLMTRYAPQVGGVFSGHIHGFCKTSHHGVPYFLCGAAGVAQDHRYGGDEITTEKSYVMLTVADGRITDTLHCIDRERGPQQQVE